MMDWEEYNRWMSQARHTLKMVDADVDYGGYGWACFKAHQAAEFALKGFFRLIGDPRFGHSIQALLSDLPMECRKLVTSHHRKCARLLDRFYIPPRYADAFSEGAPWEHYDKDDALEARECAELLIGLVEACANDLRDSKEEDE